MKHTTSIVAALLLAAVPSFAGTAPSGKACCQPAPAEEPAFSYNYLEAGWTHLNFDDFGNTDGYYLHASFSPVNSLYLFGEWGQDFGNPDRNLVDLGVGVYIPLVKRVHWFTTAGAGWVETDAAAESDSSWAFNASTGLRIRTCPRSELELAYDLSVDSDDTHHGASAAILYNVTPQVQLVVRGHFSQDENGFGVGVRYNF
ncbi:MAG: hypothetical protein K1X78_13055 [Verrucomicrobiaceae bacterium]|nr:hypothetical protein [Verrucomicrobiaceae bacterium]